jgi:hypothetical protein
MIKRIESVRGVHKASFAAIYGRLLKDNSLGMVVYLGVQASGVQQLEFNQAPTRSAVLPGEITTASERATAAFIEASAKGNFEEDRSMGHSLSKDAFVVLADKHWGRLVEVLHNSRDAKQRAIAAQVIAYAHDKRQIVQELIPAVRDPNAEVRNNSTRALSLIFTYAKTHPEISIAAPPDLVQTLARMLDSSEWLDRNKATALLLSLDDDQAVLQILREQSIPCLVEMSNWQTGHGTMAFMLLGSLTGMTHEESMEAWNQDQQPSVIARAEQIAN